MELPYITLPFYMMWSSCMNHSCYRCNCSLFRLFRKLQLINTMCLLNYHYLCSLVKTYTLPDASSVLSGCVHYLPCWSLSKSSMLLYLTAAFLVLATYCVMWSSHCCHAPLLLLLLPGAAAYYTLLSRKWKPKLPLLCSKYWVSVCYLCYL